MEPIGKVFQAVANQILVNQAVANQAVANQVLVNQAVANQVLVNPMLSRETLRLCEKRFVSRLLQVDFHQRLTHSFARHQLAKRLRRTGNSVGDIFHHFDFSLSNPIFQLRHRRRHFVLESE